MFLKAPRAISAFKKEVSVESSTGNIISCFKTFLRYLAMRPTLKSSRCEMRDATF